MPFCLKRDINELVDHDIQWEIIASQTIKRLWEIFGPVASDIQHIGSTSIKNIKAKPIIDIAVAVDSFENFSSLIPELENSGFSYRGWFIVDRIYVLNVYEEVTSDDRVITHHVHIVKNDGSDWRNHIIFRDYLNAHPATAKEYETLKINLASEHPYDVNRKNDNNGKNQFIIKTLYDANI